tara:strand:- start:691 stop:897 length:207 start_codon:yes stop_codon:yes gene_type:complete
LKFGPVEVVQQVTLVVTVVHFQLADMAADMPTRQSIHNQTVSIRYVLAEAGHVIKHTPVQVEWDAVLM